jgi:hypothetical protein
MMRAMTAVALVLALATGCATANLEDFKWTVEVPQTVDKGTEFHLNVKTVRLAAAGAEPGEPEVVEGIPYHYQIHWPGGTAAPLRHAGFTGEPIKIRARMAAGPATILITALNREGLDAKALETKIEVK